MYLKMVVKILMSNVILIINNRQITIHSNFKAMKLFTHTEDWMKHVTNMLICLCVIHHFTYHLMHMAINMYNNVMLLLVWNVSSPSLNTLFVRISFWPLLCSWGFSFLSSFLKELCWSFRVRMKLFFSFKC